MKVPSQIHKDPDDGWSGNGGIRPLLAMTQAVDSGCNKGLTDQGSLKTAFLTSERHGPKTYSDYRGRDPGRCPDVTCCNEDFVKWGQQ